MWASSSTPNESLRSARRMSARNGSADGPRRAEKRFVLRGGRHRCGRPRLDGVHASTVCKRTSKYFYIDLLTIVGFQNPQRCCDNGACSRTLDVSMGLDSKLPHVGTTIFTVMSQARGRSWRDQPVARISGFRWTARAARACRASPDARPQSICADAGRRGAARTGRAQSRPICTAAAVDYGYRGDDHGRCDGGDLLCDHRGRAARGRSDRVRPGIRLLRAGSDPCGGRDAARAAYCAVVYARLGSGARCPDVADAAVDHQYAAQPNGFDLARKPTCARCAKSRAITTSSSLATKSTNTSCSTARRHESLLRYPDLYARSFVVSSFGKTYHATGWKTGYCVAPHDADRRTEAHPSVRQLRCEHADSARAGRLHGDCA